MGPPIRRLQQPTTGPVHPSPPPSAHPLRCSNWSVPPRRRSATPSWPSRGWSASWAGTRPPWPLSSRLNRRRRGWRRVGGRSLVPPRTSARCWPTSPGWRRRRAGGASGTRLPLCGPARASRRMQAPTAVGGRGAAASERWWRPSGYCPIWPSRRLGRRRMGGQRWWSSTTISFRRQWPHIASCSPCCADSTTFVLLRPRPMEPGEAAGPSRPPT
mmetsp:Transcript_17661/g.50592  ORF Transcript_17661/g.50592 Transcript_17661/m.50592 type:complete len:215 (+) Transcript_17661:1008-1652(+)